MQRARAARPTPVDRAGIAPPRAAHSCTPYLRIEAELALGFAVEQPRRCAIPRRLPPRVGVQQQHGGDGGQAQQQAQQAFVRLSGARRVGGGALVGAELQEVEGEGGRGITTLCIALHELRRGQAADAAAGSRPQGASPPPPQDPRPARREAESCGLELCKHLKRQVPGPPRGLHSSSSSSGGGSSAASPLGPWPPRRAW